MQKEYIEPSPGRPSRPPAPGTVASRTVPETGSSRWSPQVQTGAQIDGSPHIRDSGPRPSLRPPGMESIIQVNSMYSVPDHPPGVFDPQSSVPTFGSDTSTSPRFPAAGPEPRQFMSSAVAEGHLPLLNQVLQHAKRWIDWEWVLDPKAPSTTPIWDAYGTMSEIEVCRGRGNTKKLAKNDAARWLVTELQTKIGWPCTTSDLAKELIAFHTERKVCTIVDSISHLTMRLMGIKQALVGFSGDDETILSNKLGELNLREKPAARKQVSSIFVCSNPYN